MRDLEHYLVPQRWVFAGLRSSAFYMTVVDLRRDRVEWSWSFPTAYPSTPNQPIDQFQQSGAVGYEPSSLRGNNRRR
jgi:hypothetical protein